MDQVGCVGVVKRVYVCLQRLQHRRWRMPAGAEDSLAATTTSSFWPVTARRQRGRARLRRSHYPTRAGSVAFGLAEQPANGEFWRRSWDSWLSSPALGGSRGWAVEQLFHRSAYGGRCSCVRYRNSTCRALAHRLVQSPRDVVVGEATCSRTVVRVSCASLYAALTRRRRAASPSRIVGASMYRRGCSVRSA